MTLWVDDEDLMQRYANVSIADRIRVTVSEARVERVALQREEFTYRLEACDLEYLRLLLNHFSIEGSEQTVR